MHLIAHRGAVAQRVEFEVGIAPPLWRVEKNAGLSRVFPSRRFTARRKLHGPMRNAAVSGGAAHRRRAKKLERRRRRAAAPERHQHTELDLRKHRGFSWGRAENPGRN
eukprot:SAG11_NODE_10833_length_803_cov_0.634943_1_plen_107_part_10